MFHWRLPVAQDLGRCFLRITTCLFLSTCQNFLFLARVREHEVQWCYVKDPNLDSCLIYPMFKLAFGYIYFLNFGGGS